MCGGCCRLRWSGGARRAFVSSGACRSVWICSVARVHTSCHCTVAENKTRTYDGSSAAGSLSVSGTRVTRCLSLCCSNFPPSLSVHSSSSTLSFSTACLSLGVMVTEPIPLHSHHGIKNTHCAKAHLQFINQPPLQSYRPFAPCLEPFPPKVELAFFSSSRSAPTSSHGCRLCRSAALLLQSPNYSLVYFPPHLGVVFLSSSRTHRV